MAEPCSHCQGVGELERYEPSYSRFPCNFCSRTTINFGQGELMQVGLPLKEAVELVQRGLRESSMVEFMADNGEVLVVNPFAVTVIRDSS